MQKNKYCLLWFVAMLAFSPALAQPVTIYYTATQKPTHVWNEYLYNFDPQSLAEDMAALLQQATGTKTVTAPYTSGAKTGIFLLLDSTTKYAAKEAAFVECNGSNTLSIKARYANGLSYALYTYLDRLGFRFYLPGSTWTIVPQLSTAFPKTIARQEWKPWFKHRICTISGAMPAVKGLDDKSVNAAEWFKWYRRNRMGSEYMGIAGHIGELFNMTHQKEIEQDPTLIAPEDGKQRKYSVSAKLDPMNNRGVTMFTDWVLEQYRLDNATRPSYIPWPTYQSVDPGDGLGYCHTPDCDKKFKSISDQVFYIANIAAKKMATRYPGSGVSLYAYTERTDTPSIKLDPNVHVEIVASAFHNVATPAALINRWRKKTQNLTIYDYINIGVWNKEEPFFNLTQYFKYLDYIKSLNIKGFTFESATSKFSSGLLQYFILRYLCEPYGNVQQEFDTFCRNAFGSASAPIGKMMQEWYFSDVKLATNYDQTTFHEDELGRFFGYLQQADGSNPAPAVQQRLNELKAYTVYLTKHFEYWNDVRLREKYINNPVIRKQQSEEMLTYTWKLYKSMIFHNTQLNDVVRWYFPEDNAFMQRWDYYKSPVFANFNQQYDATPDYQQALKTYLPKATADYPITDAFLEKAARFTPDSIRLLTIDEEAFVGFRYALQVYCPAPGKFTVQFDAGNSKKPNPKIPSTGFVAVMSDDYTYYSENYLQPSKQKGTLQFNLPKKGHYVLWLAQNNATPIRFTVKPGKNLLYINKKTIPMNGILLLDESDNKYKGNKYLAMYVPPNVKQIQYNMLYHDCVNYVQWYNAKGKALVQNNSQSPFNITVDIPSVDANNFIFMTNGLFRWPPIMKNVPPYYFFLKYPPLP